ncbi:23S rRNA (pseudouridine(1915)-N(3))-methyltransferase RlmH [bacterium]|nr:23S rRNA (pseudouridine(1915)-N(3))-methyltransferase RlmH [bacterium]
MRKIRILCIGKNQEPYLKEGLAIYEKKLKRYCKFKLHTIKEANYKSGSKNQWIEEEGEKLVKLISPSN